MRGVAGGENKTGKWCSESESEMSTRLTAADSVHVECVGAFDRGGRESCPVHWTLQSETPEKVTIVSHIPLDRATGLTPRGESYKEKKGMNSASINNFHFQSRQQLVNPIKFTQPLSLLFQ